MADQSAPPNKPFSSFPPPPEDTRTSLMSNILAIAGFIIIIVVVIWGLVNLAGLSRGWFSSIFGGGSGSEIAITAPETATSGETFSVSWKYNPTVDGSYAFLYPCASGLQFSMPNAAGVVNAVPCGAAFSIPQEDSALSLVPFLSGTSSLPVPISILFLPAATGTTPVQGSATVRILAAEGAQSPRPSTPTTPTPSPTPTPRPTPAPTPATPADLSVRIISVVPEQSGITTVSFSIANLGGTASGSYYFSAVLPTTSDGSYTSPVQASLSSGSSIVSTLRFTQLRPGGGVFSVNADSNNSVRESNENNNSASQTVTSGYQSYNPYQYYPYNYNNYNQYPYGNQYPYNYYNNQYPYTQYYPYAQ